MFFAGHLIHHEPEQEHLVCLVVGKHPVALAAVVLHDERQRNLFLQDIVHRGDDAGAEEAAKKAVEAIEASAADNVEFVQMVLNHAATLAQLGNPEDAMGAVDELLSPDSEVTLPGDTYYQALNLKAMILYRSGNLKAAADTFAELVDEARERGALKNQLPSICLNCAHIYQRVGDEESATRYSSIAAALSSDGR